MRVGSGRALAKWTIILWPFVALSSANCLSIPTYEAASGQPRSTSAIGALHNFSVVANDRLVFVRFKTNKGEDAGACRMLDALPGSSDEASPIACMEMKDALPLGAIEKGKIVQFWRGNTFSSFDFSAILPPGTQVRAPLVPLDPPGSPDWIEVDPALTILIMRWKAGWIYRFARQGRGAPLYGRPVDFRPLASGEVRTPTDMRVLPRMTEPYVAVLHAGSESYYRLPIGNRSVLVDLSSRVHLLRQPQPAFWGLLPFALVLDVPLLPVVLVGACLKVDFSPGF